VEHALAGPELERRQIEAQASDRARRAAEDHLERRLAEAQARVPADAHGVPPRSVTEGEQDWPCDLDALRRLLGDQDLARQLEQPLSTDVECDVPPAIWHLMAVLELRRRGRGAHPLAIRAAIVRNCGYSLTGEAIAGVLAVARDTP
jgi:hypothetical protein